LSSSKNSILQNNMTTNKQDYLDKINGATNQILTKMGLEEGNENRDVNIKQCVDAIAAIDEYIESVILGSLMSIDTSNISLDSTSNNNNSMAILGAINLVSLQTTRDNLDKVSSYLSTLSSAPTNSASTSKSMFGF